MTHKVGFHKHHSVQNEEKTKAPIMKKTSRVSKRVLILASSSSPSEVAEKLNISGQPTPVENDPMEDIGVQFNRLGVCDSDSEEDQPRAGNSSTGIPTLFV